MIISRLVQFLLFVFIAIHFSCCTNPPKEEEAEEQVKQMVGDTFYLPESSEILYKDSVYQNNEPIHKDATLKIATLIQGECNSCVKELKKWSHFSQFIDAKKEAEILFYLYTTNVPFFRRKIYNGSIHKYPLIIDKNYTYVDTNDIPPRKKQYQTFLLDSTNKVILVGNPIYSEKLMKLYKQEINKRLN